MKTMPFSRYCRAWACARAALHFGDGDMGFNVVLVFVNVIGGAVLKREREMASVTLDLSL